MANSLFGKIYRDILARLAAQQVPARYINLDLGQLNYDGDRPAISFPAVLIKFNNWTFETLGDKSQIGTGYITVKVVYAAFSNASNLNNSTTQNNALKYLELVHDVNKALHGWSGPNTGTLTRENQDDEDREDNINVTVLTYSASAQDNSAAQALTSVPVNYLVNGQSGTLPSFILSFNKQDADTTYLEITSNAGSFEVTCVDLYILAPNITILEQNYLNENNEPNMNIALENINSLAGGDLIDDYSFEDGYCWLIAVLYSLSNGAKIWCYAELWQDPTSAYHDEPLEQIYPVASANTYPAEVTGNSSPSHSGFFNF